MRKSSGSSSRSVSRRSPFIEEGDEGWEGGLMESCRCVMAGMGNKSLEKRRYEGMMRLLNRVFEGVRSAGRKIKGNEQQDAQVEVRSRLSDGKKADYHRKALVA